MREYIVTFDGINNSPNTRGELTRCRDCLHFSTDDGIPWCEVYVVPRTEDGFCNLAKAKKEEEQA